MADTILERKRTMNNITPEQIFQLNEDQLIDLCFRFPYKKQWESEKAYNYTYAYIKYVYKGNGHDGKTIKTF